MSTFVLREIVNRVLTPLDAVVARLPELHVAFWSFKEVEFAFGRPFGIPLPDFERLSRELVGGFVVSDEDFREFLKGEFQLVDGVIEAYGSAAVLVRIDCEDASLWGIHAEQPEIIRALEERELKRGLFPK